MQIRNESDCKKFINKIIINRDEEFVFTVGKEDAYLITNFPLITGDSTLIVCRLKWNKENNELEVFQCVDYEKPELIKFIMKFKDYINAELRKKDLFNVIFE